MLQHAFLHRLQLDDVLGHVSLGRLSAFLRPILFDWKCLALLERRTFSALVQHAVVLGDRPFVRPAHIGLVGLVFALLDVMEVVQIGVLVLVFLFRLAVSDHLVRGPDQPLGARIMRLDQDVLGVGSVRCVPLSYVVKLLRRMVRELLLRQVRIPTIPRLLHFDRTSTRATDVCVFGLRADAEDRQRHVLIGSVFSLWIILLTISSERRPQLNLIVNIGKFVGWELVYIRLHQHIQFFLVPILSLPQDLIILGGFVVFYFRCRGVLQFTERRRRLTLLFNWRPRIMLLQLIRLKRLYHILGLVLNAICLEIHRDRRRVKVVAGSVFLLVEI